MPSRGCTTRSLAVPGGNWDVRHHTGLDRLLLGSVTSRIARTVDVPVLCVNANAVSDAEPRTQFETILVPTDGSKPARGAVTYALDIARMYDASLHALYVIDRRTYASRPGFTWNELQQALEQTGETVLEDVRSRAAEDGISVVSESRHGVPHQEIQEYCNHHDIDLIVMGTHGRSGLYRQLIGSVTERVLRHSNVPVMTVREA